VVIVVHIYAYVQECEIWYVDYQYTCKLSGVTKIFHWAEYLSIVWTDKFNKNEICVGIEYIFQRTVTAYHNNTVKPQFNVPTFSEILDLVIIFSCPNNSST
jgi:hypothetical protein